MGGGLEVPDNIQPKQVLEDVVSGKYKGKEFLIVSAKTVTFQNHSAILLYSYLGCILAALSIGLGLQVLRYLHVL